MIGSQVRSSVRWLTATRIGGKLVAALVGLLVVRLLAPEEFGLLAMATVVVGLLLLINEMGLGAALIQQGEITKDEIEYVFGFVLIANLLLYGVVAVVAPVAAAFFDEPRLTAVIQVLALRLPLSATAVVQRSLLQKSMQFRNISLVELVALVIGALATLSFALAGLGVWALVGGVLVSGVCEVTALHVIATEHYRPRFSLTKIRKQAAFGGLVTADRVLWYAYTQADVVIIGKLLGNESVGVYFVAKRLAALPLDKLSSVVTEVGFAAYSRVWSNTKRIDGYYCRAVGMAGLISFPVCFGIVSVAELIVPIALGKGWSATVPIFQLLLLVTPLRQLNSLNTPALIAIGEPRRNVENLVLALIIMPAAFLVGARFGVLGVAVAWAIAYPGYFLIMLMRSLPILGVAVSDYAKAIWAPASSAVFMLCIVEIAQESNVFQSFPALVEVLVSGIIGVFVYSVMIYVLDRKALAEVLRFVSR